MLSAVSAYARGVFNPAGGDSAHSFIPSVWEPPEGKLWSWLIAGRRQNDDPFNWSELRKGLKERKSREQQLRQYMSRMQREIQRVYDEFEREKHKQGSGERFRRRMAELERRMRNETARIMYGVESADERESFLGNGVICLTKCFALLVACNLSLGLRSLALACRQVRVYGMDGRGDEGGCSAQPACSVWRGSRAMGKRGGTKRCRHCGTG